MRVRPDLPSLLTKRPPKARSTTTWSYSAKACERGSLCSRVKPCGASALSSAPPVATALSLCAVFSVFIEYMVRNWFLWQLPQLAGSICVVGRPLPALRCASRPVWHESQPTVLCEFFSWNSWMASWHS